MFLLLIFLVSQRNIAGARDPEVLSLFSQAIEKLGDAVQQYVPRIMEAVFECTLLMITRNFEVSTRRIHTATYVVNYHNLRASLSCPTGLVSVIMRIMRAVVVVVGTSLRL